MTTPAPGFTYPSPRTWSTGDIHTAPRWRADMTNLGYLFAGKARPMLLSVNTTAQALSSGSNTPLYLGANVPLNTWSVVVQNSNSPSNVTAYQIPFAGIYLLQGDVAVTMAGTPTSQKYGMGFRNVINGAGAADQDGGSFPAANTTSVLNGMDGTELIQFNTFANTADTTALYAFTSNASPGANKNSEFLVEWVGLPVSGLTNYTGPYGTKVASPAIVSAPPSGQGTTLVYPCNPGDTKITIADPTGIVPAAGTTIGLDVINGQFSSAQAETVIVSAASGAVLTLSAAVKFPHAAGAPVAVPLSAAFMNQQLRDVVNFLSYPPMVRAVSNSTQSLATQVFPAGTQITTLGTDTIDNFSNFSGNTLTATVAGVYLVYGQVYLAGSTSSFSAAAGLAVNGGTVNWGTRFASTSGTARTVCATVRRHLRLNAGDTVTLYGTQNSGAGMNTVSSGSAFSKFISVWRSV